MQQYNVKTRKAKPQAMLSIRSSTTPPNLGSTLEELLSEVADYLEDAGIEPAGPPFARYYEFQDDEVDLEAGFPVEKPASGEGRIEPGELPGGRTAVTTHVGPYEKLGDAHDAVGEWVLAHRRDTQGAPWEVYLTGPGAEPDSSRWQTEIVWPLRK